MRYVRLNVHLDEGLEGEVILVTSTRARDLIARGFAEPA